MSRSVLASVICTLDRNVRKNGQEPYISRSSVPAPGLAGGGQAAAHAEPAGQDDPRLGPAEDPRDRPQVVEAAVATGPLGRPRADVHLAELVDRGGGHEERHQAGVADQRPVGDLARPGDHVHRRRSSRPARPAAAASVRCSTEASRTAASADLEVPAAQTGQRVLARDDLALLGDLDRPVEAAVGLRQDRLAASGRRRGRPSRRDRGRAAAPRRARRAMSRRARWARWICHWDAAMPASLEESE